MLQKCWWYFPRTSLKLATWICEGSVWSILLEHSSGIKLVRHLLNFGYWSCKFWQLCYYEISYEENGDIVFWIPMFDEFLCLEVNPSGFDSKKHWIWYSVDDDAIISCCNWAGFYPNANEVWSPVLPKPKGNEFRWLVLFICKSFWKWDYHCWRCTRAYYIIS